jgi:hypothetical protein
MSRLLTVQRGAICHFTLRSGVLKRQIEAIAALPAVSAWRARCHKALAEPHGASQTLERADPLAADATLLRLAEFFRIWCIFAAAAAAAAAAAVGC